jgi:hypothetical protein
MAAHYLENLRALAERCAERDTTLYFPDFDTDPGPGSLNRVGGPPIGVSLRTWPRVSKARLAKLMKEAGGEWDGEDTRMEHLFTVDLAGIGKDLGAPEGARAMSVFISDALYNSAYSQGTDETAVVFLREEDCAKGPFKGAVPTRSEEHEVKTFSLVKIVVPSKVFVHDATEADADLGALHKAIFNAPAYLGGEPIWVQGDPDENDFGDDEDDGDEDEDEDEDDGDEDEDEDDGDDEGDNEEASASLSGGPTFMLQFGEEFVDVNLGDCGTMYVFGDDAFWQCY